MHMRAVRASVAALEATVDRVLKQLLDRSHSGLEDKKTEVFKQFNQKTTKTGQASTTLSVSDACVHKNEV